MHNHKGPITPSTYWCAPYSCSYEENVPSIAGFRIGVRGFPITAVQRFNRPVALACVTRSAGGLASSSPALRSSWYALSPALLMTAYRARKALRSPTTRKVAPCVHRCKLDSYYESVQTIVCRLGHANRINLRARGGSHRLYWRTYNLQPDLVFGIW